MDEGDRIKVFILMPFAPKFDSIYKVIREVLEDKDMQCICSRIDQNNLPGVIVDDIREKIKDTDLIIADVTGLNPNVLYELGIAHAEKGYSNCIILTQSRKKLPFDLQHLRSHFYKDSIEGADKLKSFIKRAVREFSVHVYD